MELLNRESNQKKEQTRKQETTASLRTVPQMPGAREEFRDERYKSGGLRWFVVKGLHQSNMDLSSEFVDRKNNIWL